MLAESSNLMPGAIASLNDVVVVAAALLATLLLAGALGRWIECGWIERDARRANPAPGVHDPRDEDAEGW